MNLVIMLLTVLIAFLFSLTFLPSAFVFPFFVATQLRDDPNVILDVSDVSNISFY